MARPKGTKNRNTAIRRLDSLSPQNKMEVLASLIVDKILEDKQNGGVLIKQLEDTDV